jgi:hypothetical protein
VLSGGTFAAKVTLSACDFISVLIGMFAEK